MDIERELNKIIDAKLGNKEIALFHEPYSTKEDRWVLLVGNPTTCVMLGEVDGELSTEGTSIPDVIMKMKVKLNIS